MAFVLWSSPNHTLIKYQGLIRKSNWITPTYLKVHTFTLAHFSKEHTIILTYLWHVTKNCDTLCKNIHGRGYINMQVRQLIRFEVFGYWWGNLFYGKLNQLSFDPARWWWPEVTPFLSYSAKEGRNWITKQIALKKFRTNGIMTPPLHLPQVEYHLAQR